MDDNSLDRLFSGNLDKLPPLPKRVVRLFISSTFTDMTLERNTLMERVYPRMKKYCRERHGLDFQVVDMRWGVRDEATDDHQTVELCSREISNCQRVSLGPNFVALIGDKYGFRPLPSRIRSTEYRSLRRCLIESDINTDFLDTWYREDSNAIPAEYALQPISSILKNFTNKSEPELQKIDQRIWQAIQSRLHELLLIGSQRLVGQGRMSQREQLMKYSISVTEREVIEGCLDASDTKRHCLVYVRSIVDISDHLSKCLASAASATASVGASSAASKRLQSPLEVSLQPDSVSRRNLAQKSTMGRGSSNRNERARRASLKIGGDSISLATSGAQTAAERKIERTRRLIAKFIDLKMNEDGDWELDQEAQEALRTLKDNKLNSRLLVNKKNLNFFQVHWHESEGICSKFEEHKRYLNNLSEQFYSQLTRMVRNAVRGEQKDRVIKTGGLIGEILQHSHYAAQAGRSVGGRLNELDHIKRYILFGNLENVHSTRTANESHQDIQSKGTLSAQLPMFVYGVSGSGKTSVLARAATQAHQWIKLARQRRLSSIHLQQAQQLGSQSQQQASCDSFDKWDREPCMIMRFCCTTPASSSMVGALTSICRQLQYNFYQFGPLNGICTDLEQKARAGNAPERMHSLAQEERTVSQGRSRSELAATQLPFGPIPNDFVRLVFTFRQLLDNCRHPLHRRRLFVIILDSVERLSTPTESDVQSKYSWLTGIERLPSNVRLIVSCSSSDESFGHSYGPAGDFHHLKRHFLRMYYNNLRPDNDENNVSQRDEDPTDSSDDEISIDLSGSPVSACGHSMGEPTSAPSRNVPQSATPIPHFPFEGGRKYRMLKRIVIPAVRLIRGSRENVHTDSKRDTSRNSLNVGCAPRVSWSPHAIDLDRSPLMQANPWSARKAGTEEAGEEAYLDDDRSAALHVRQYPNAALGMLHIKPVGSEMARKILAKMLAEHGRNLTSQQWSIVERSFSRCSRPIFIKLTLGEVLHWKSYSTQGDTRGLTFGSAWLGELKSEDSVHQSGTTQFGFGSELLRFIEEEKGPDGLDELLDERSEQFRWQTLTMEQQWLNYLDYKQRRDKSGAGNDYASLTNDSSGLVIRINVALNGRDQTSKSKDTHTHSANSSLAAIVAATSSSSSLSLCHLSDTIEDAICQLFARIELQHGYLLTKHSLSYINAGRSGICENELEDILSLDDVVLDDVFQYHLPPIRRIPPLLWTRIRNDLNDYLSERDSDGIVIGWHYGQFQLVAEQRYLGDQKQAAYIHSIMADYFLGKWADKAKPFRCTRQQIFLAAEQFDSATQQSLRDSQQGASRSSLSGYSGTRLGSGSAPRSGVSFSVRNRLRSSDQHDQRLQWMQAKADRRVPQQPLYYLSSPSSSSGHLQHSPSSYSKFGAERSNTDLDGRQVSSSDGVAKKRRYNLRKLVELPFHLMQSGRFTELAANVLFNYQWILATINSIGLQSLFVDFAQSLECLASELRRRRQGEQVVSEVEEGVAIHFTGQSANQLPELASDEVAVSMDSKSLESLIKQLNILTDTLRLAASVINLDQQMLAPQLIGRLLAVVPQFSDGEMSTTAEEDNTLMSATKCDGRKRHQEQLTKRNWLRQLIEQSDQFGCHDCSLLPVAQCFQSADGLQLGSLESHTGPFGVTSVALTTDNRHLLTGSKKFFMWDITTGEVVRDFEPPEVCSCIRDLRISANNEVAVAYSRENNIIALNIQTQQVSLCKCPDLDGAAIGGLKLIDSYEAKVFFIWTETLWRVFKLKDIKLGSLHASNQAGYEQQGQQWAEIEQEYEFDLQLNEFPKSLKLYSVDIERQSARNVDLTFLILLKAKEMKLLTLEVTSGLSTNDCRKIWSEQHKMSAKLMCLSDNLRQLIFVDSSDDIYLRRRRAEKWSSPKLLRQAEGDSGAGLHSVSQTMQALEVDSIDQANELNGQRISTKEDSIRLAEFEEKLDPIVENEEMGRSHVFSRTNSKMDGGILGKPNYSNRSRGLRFVKIYLPTQLIVVRLDKRTENDYGRMYEENCCNLPRDIQNVSIGDNRCQTMSTIMELDQGASHYLIVSATRRILVYKLELEQLIENIDAHEARMTKILPIYVRDHQIERNQGRRKSSVVNKDLSISENRPLDLCLASASMDKTVKIWNLTNIGKQRKSIAKLANAIETMNLCNNWPLVACMAKGGGQIGVWDWSTLELISRWSAKDFFSRKQSEAGANQERAHTYLEQKFTACRFSSSGRYMLVTTSTHLHLFTVEGASDFHNALPDARKKTSDRWEFVECLKSQLPANLVVLRVEFVMQDATMIIIGRYPKTIRQEEKLSEKSPGGVSVAEENSDSSRPSSQLSTASSQPSVVTRQLLVLCLSVPFGQILYSIDIHTPILGATAARKQNEAQEKKRLLFQNNSFSGKQQTDTATSTVVAKNVFMLGKTRVCKPILSNDGQSLIALEYVPSLDADKSLREEGAAKQTVLSIYNVLDGTKTKTIDLNQLVSSTVQQQQPDTTLLGTNLNRNSTEQQEKVSTISIDLHQITKMKSLHFRNKSSFVALINEVKNVVYLIDSDSTSPHVPVMIVRNWNCKLSSDGRYGLSARVSNFAWADPTQTAAHDLDKNQPISIQRDSSAVGIHLLDTRHFRPIKSLVDREQLYQLTGSEMNDIRCEFTRPLDACVYVHSPRSARILLVRLRDTQVIANYKSTVGIAKMKCTSDGSSVLVVGHLDGTISSLAIVDPQETESLARLARFPSRMLR